MPRPRAPRGAASASKPASGSAPTRVLLVKPAKAYSDYRLFAVTSGRGFNTVNSIRGRLYAGRKTMQAEYKSYKTAAEAARRVEALVAAWEAKGYERAPMRLLEEGTKALVVYDKAKWHYEGEFPEDLPAEAAATHIGMFLAWCVSKGLASAELLADHERDVGRLARRTITPGAFLMASGEAFVSDQLNDDGNAFALAYYQGRKHDPKYIDDYYAAFRLDEHSVYRVPDTWKSFDQLRRAIDRRYVAWIAAGRPKYLS